MPMAAGPLPVASCQLPVRLPWHLNHSDQEMAVVGEAGAGAGKGDKRAAEKLLNSRIFQIPLQRETCRNVACSQPR